MVTRIFLHQSSDYHGASMAKMPILTQAKVRCQSQIELLKYRIR